MREVCLFSQYHFQNFFFFFAYHFYQNSEKWSSISKACEAPTLDTDWVFEWHSPAVLGSVLVLEAPCLSWLPFSQLFPHPSLPAAVHAAENSVHQHSLPTVFDLSLHDLHWLIVWVFGGLGYGGHSPRKQTGNCPTPTAICLNSCAWSTGSISNLDSHSVLFFPESNLWNPSLIFCATYLYAYPCEPVSGHIYHVCCAVVLKAGPGKLGTHSSLRLWKQSVSASQVDWWLVKQLARLPPPSLCPAAPCKPEDCVLTGGSLNRLNLA